MIRNISILLLALIFTTNIEGQITTNTSKTPAQLVQQVLVGQGVTVSNVTFTGASVAICEFGNAGTSNLGITSGIVLSTGNATDLVGPNNVGNKSTNNNTGSDPQLASLINATINDAAVLEFDFVPISDTIRFRYVFGSEEYPEFVNSFNDVFGFFITGPNPNGGNYTNQNIAIIPGTTNTPVSIYNVNNGTSNNGPCVNCQYYVNNTGGLTVQYDGFTTVLTAMAIVIPCQTYHIKLAVGDAGDHVYDSGVMLEANSFSSNAVQITSGFTVQGSIKKAIEGCNAATITAKLPRKLNTDYVVHIDTMWGTATNGVDFPHIPDSIVIAAGTLSNGIIIAPIADHVIEGQEDWNIVIHTTPCNVDTIVIPIVDYDPITFSQHPNDTMVCGDSAILRVYPQGGWQPYTIFWMDSTGINNNNSLITKGLPPQSTMLYVSVTDSSGCGSTDSMYVQVEPKLNVSFLPDVMQGCEPLKVNFTDLSGPNPGKWDWDFGDGNTSNKQNPTHTYDAGVYDVKLKVESPNGCKGEVEIQKLINAYPKPNVWFEPDPEITTIEDPTINFTNKTQGGSSWMWNFGEPNSSNNTSTFQDPSHTYENEGDYIVWLVATSDKGCKDSVMRAVKVIVDEIEIPNVITPNHDGVNDYFVIKNIERIESSTLRIYNRWGKKIFEASPYKNDWDGNGAPDGVYYYELDYKTYFQEGTKSGTVTIISH